MLYINYFLDTFYLYKKFNYSLEFSYMRIILKKSRFLMLSGAKKKEIYISYKYLPYNLREKLNRYNYILPFNFNNLEFEKKKLIPSFSFYFFTTLRFLDFLINYNFILNNIINYIYFNYIFYYNFFDFFNFFNINKKNYIIKKLRKKKLKKLIKKYKYKYNKKFLYKQFNFIRQFYFLNNN